MQPPTARAGTLRGPNGPTGDDTRHTYGTWRWGELPIGSALVHHEGNERAYACQGLRM